MVTHLIMCDLIQFKGVTHVMKELIRYRNLYQAESKFISALKLGVLKRALMGIDSLLEPALSGH